MEIKNKLQQGFASIIGTALETKSFINSDTFLKGKNDLDNVFFSIEKIIDELKWCKDIINKPQIKRGKEMTEQLDNETITEDLPKILFFDTETSGFIKKALAADDPEQAWTVQIGALLTDTEGKEIDKLNVIIKANGREMNYHAEQIHGISIEKADNEGIEEVDAAEQFGLLLQQASLVVGHNFDFDWKYAQHLLERNMDDLSDEARSAFYLDVPNQCTMKDKKIVKFCALKNKIGRVKVPKLIELHEILFEEPFEGAHDAFADITATKNCYFELVKRGIIESKLVDEKI